MKTVDLNDIEFIGSGLKRPECVHATKSGHLLTSDWRGGVTIIAPNGEIKSLLARDAGFELKPNGFCIKKDGSFLIAHLGDDAGGVFHLQLEGTLRPFLTEIEGDPLPPTNYIHIDYNDRVWITISTRQQPRALGYRPDVSDGYVILVDQGEARIVADNLGYTNECLVSPDRKTLLVNETFSRRLTKFNIGENGDLSNKQTITEFGPGTFPDGLIVDQDGGIWITSILSNRVIHVAPDGHQTIVLEDFDPEQLEIREQAFQTTGLGRSHLDTLPHARLRNISSLAFGGPGLKTAYLGCLLGDSIATFPSPVAGHPPVHWDLDGKIYFNTDHSS